MKVWDLPGDIELRSLFQWCLDHDGVDRITVIHRLKYGSPTGELLHPEGIEWARDFFGERILRTRSVHRWPGTISARHPAIAQVVAFDKNLAGAMSDVCNKLFFWLGTHTPSLPEDLCLFRSGTSLPTIYSVTHEREGWALSSDPIPLSGVVESQFELDDLLIPDGDIDLLGD